MTPKEKFLELANQIKERNTYGNQYYKDKIQGIPVDVITSQRWHFDLQAKFQAHTLVLKSLETYYPQDLTTLLLQWPHESEKDNTRLAYTRTFGQSDKQVVTSVGKYLRRHFPTMEDHVLRDYLALYAPAQYEFLDTKEDFIHAVSHGPKSCMTTTYGSIPFKQEDVDQMDAWRLNPEEEDEPEWDKHPYSCYDPSYGWGMVIRKVDGRIDGRALTLKHNCNKLFVRTFARPENPEDFAVDDHALTAWLLQNGYQKRSAWPEGAKLDYIERPYYSMPLVPYIDGDNQCITVCHEHLVIDCTGEYKCENSDGTPEEAAHFDATCADCDEGINTNYDEYYSVGQYGRLICACCSENYTVVEGNSDSHNDNERYLVHNDEAARLWNRDRYIDSSNPPDWAIRTEDHDLAHQDDCWEDHKGDWWTNDKDKIIYEGKCYPEDDCWQSDATGIWYPDEVGYLGSGGFKYLKDELDRVSTDAEEGMLTLAFDREQGGCEIPPRQLELPL